MSLFLKRFRPVRKNNFCMSRIVVFLIFTTVLSSVFYPVDAKRKKSEQIVITPEEAFLDDNFDEKCLKEWNSGREFVCVTRELPVLLGINMLSSPSDDFSGKIFTYRMLEEEKGWSGSETAIVFECEGRKYKYKVKKSAGEMLAGCFRPLLPELVPLDYVAKADSLLRGRILYIRSANWSDSSGVDIKGRKYVPVTVNGVEPGDKVLPLKIVFTDSRGVTASVCTTMYRDAISSQYTSFDKLFSFTDIRERYPDINDDVWEAVTRVEVVAGMTKNEAMISVGYPDNVRKIPDNAGLREYWMYNNGTYFVFQDGLLVEYRL